jgi:hypothetical protein
VLKKELLGHLRSQRRIRRSRHSPTFVLKITREGDRFITQATGQGQVEIFPEGDHDFFAKFVNAQITFVTNSQG